MEKFFDFISKNWVVLIVIGVIVTILLQLKRIGEFFKDVFSASNPTGKPFKPLSTKGSRISDTKARGISEGLFGAMAPVFYTDEDYIYRAFKGLNVGDFGKVYNEFGLRPYYDNIGSGTGNNPVAANVDLHYWLKSELTEGEYLKLVRLYPDFF